jgi:hypothetical protein
VVVVVDYIFTCDWLVFSCLNCDAFAAVGGLKPLTQVIRNTILNRGYWNPGAVDMNKADILRINWN